VNWAERAVDINAGEQSSSSGPSRPSRPPPCQTLGRLPSGSDWSFPLMVCDLAFFQPGRSAASGRGRDSTNVGGIPATHAVREQQGWTRNRRSRSEPRRSPSLKAPPGQPDPSPATVLATVIARQSGWKRRVNQNLPTKAVSDNHHLTRPPLLILIDVEFSP
jgi:hypothetical protein